MTMTAEGRWATVPLEIAKQHPLYGVGGWLILVAIGMIATPVRVLATLAPVYAKVF